MATRAWNRSAGWDSARQQLAKPRTWHAATMLAGLVFILYLQRSQWFFFDEWAFIKVGPVPLFEPHVGHWSTSPILVFEALTHVVGINSYFWYSLLVTLFHLGVAHLIWRISIRAGADGWITTAAVSVFIFLGAGAENILWAFQIGFIGGLGFGLWAFYLACAPRVDARSLTAITALTVFSLTWSGTSLPLLAATGAMLWWHHGWKKAVVQLGIGASVYLVWYLAFVMPGPSSITSGGFTAHNLLNLMPSFMAVLFTIGFGEVFPVPGLGAAVLVAVLVWVIVVLVRRRFLPGASPAFILAVAALVFGGLTAYSRAALSIGAAASSRYVYTITLLLLPVLALALSRLVGSRTWALRTGVVLVLVLAVSQAVVLRRAAAEQAAIEQGSHRVISAALHLYVDSPSSVQMNSQPDPASAPDMQMRDLVGLYKAHEISVGTYDQNDLRRAEHNVESR